MSRDSLIFHPIVQVIAALAALAALTIATDPAGPASYGLTPVAVKWLGLVGILASQLGRFGKSPFPGKKDLAKVDSSRLPLLVIAAAIGAGALVLTGCASQRSPITLPTQAATVVQSADAKLRSSADHALGILDAAGALLDQVIVAEKKVEGLMSPKMKIDARAAMNAVNDSIENAAKLIKVGVRSEAALKAAIDPVIAAARQLSALVATLPTPSQSRSGFGALVESLLGAVMQITFGAFGGEPLTQGAQ